MNPSAAVMLGSLLLLLSSPGRAADNSAAVPDLELLEFLGKFATDEGQWIDPESLLDGDFAQMLDAAAALEQEQEPGQDSNDDTNTEITVNEP